MNRPRICVAITAADAAAIERAAPLADLFEVRIDLIGQGWRQVAGSLKKPWLACNRRAAEGGKWGGTEPERIRELIGAVKLGADTIDIELNAPLALAVIQEIGGQAECLVSYHNLMETPPLDVLRELVENELAAGADICKVVTTARAPADNLTVLRLIKEFPGKKLVSFAMGEAGQLSRVLAPLAGGYFTYASLGTGRESAAGQLDVRDLKTIYEVIGNE